MAMATTTTTERTLKERTKLDGWRLEFVASRRWYRRFPAWPSTRRSPARPLPRLRQCADQSREACGDGD